MRAAGARLTRPAPPRARATAQLFIGNIPFTVDGPQLSGMFAEFGVQDAKIVYDQQSGRSKGIAFLTFGNAEQATKAQAAMNGAVRGRAPAARRPHVCATLLFSLGWRRLTLRRAAGAGGPQHPRGDAPAAGRAPPVRAARAARAAPAPPAGAAPRAAGAHAR
jgi:RNA recognition motif-containing protein